MGITYKMGTWVAPVDLGLRRKIALAQGAGGAAPLPSQGAGPATPTPSPGPGGTPAGGRGAGLLGAQPPANAMAARQGGGAAGPGGTAPQPIPTPVGGGRPVTPPPSKLGSIRGAGGLPIENFTAWLSREDDNPTDAPRQWGKTAADRAVSRVLQKHGFYKQAIGLRLPSWAQDEAPAPQSPLANVGPSAMASRSPGFNTTGAGLIPSESPGAILARGQTPAPRRVQFGVNEGSTVTAQRPRPAPTQRPVATAQRPSPAALQAYNASIGPTAALAGAAGGARKTAADRAVESVLAKYAGPRGKNAVRVPLSKGTRFKKLKDKLSKKKGR